MIPTNYKRLFLRGIRWDAGGELTLAEGLKAAARAQLTSTRSGLLLTSTTGNGHSVTFSLPAAGQGVNPTEIATLCEELLTIYDDASAAFSANGVATPSDDQLLAEMLVRLQPVSSLEATSFHALRVAQTA